ncbi:hypothetical protein H072_5862 [Dactylellina haptotyla CBS 200.50]|uniref:tRNA ligase phosphodiesterase domain-containing protein n=1 Tax=Dactylellina haptotyla (strain CBS 200.50) TaxID=1284197 RepID=S8AGR5_DACHA|nr:hypothetical protein H072_5862 [Dactylellina haptotyla CBS 200.50]
MSPQDVLGNLEETFASNIPLFFKQLQSTDRVQRDFHVTLIHVTDSKAHSDLWRYYEDMISNGSKLIEVSVQMNHIVWDNKLMAVDVTIDPERKSGFRWLSTNEVTHMTIGTANKGVKPVESNRLLATWESKGSILGVDETRISAIAIHSSIIVGTLQAF